MLYHDSMGLLIVYEGALDSLHKKIFGISMGPSTISFLRQLHWSILGGIVASLILFLVSASAARILGTDQYGKYNFLIAIAQFISLCITWSFELAIVRALAFTQEDKASQQYIISSSLVFLLVTITVINLIALFIPISFSKSLVMLFASILAMKALADGIIRGLGLFGYQAIGKIIEAVVVGSVFLSMVRAGFFTSYTQYLIAIMIGGIIIIALYGLRIISKISLHTISYSAFQVVWTYASRAIIWSVLSTFLVFITTLIIRIQLGYHVLGQFSAYSLTSIVAMSFIGSLIANVFFPVAVIEGYSAELWRRMNRGTALLWVPAWLCASIITNVAVTLYGSGYYLSWIFGIGMAGIGVAQFFIGMYWWIIASVGLPGIRYMSFHCAIGGMLCVLTLSLVLPYSLLIGIISSYAIANIYSAWAIYRWRVVLHR